MHQVRPNWILIWGAGGAARWRRGSWKKAPTRGRLPSCQASYNRTISGGRSVGRTYESSKKDANRLWPDEPASCNRVRADFSNDNFEKQRADCREKGVPEKSSNSGPGGVAKALLNNNLPGAEWARWSWKKLAESAKKSWQSSQRLTLVLLADKAGLTANFHGQKILGRAQALPA